MLPFLGKKSPTLPIQRLLRQAEKVALQAAREPSPEMVAALAEMASMLKAWGHKKSAARIEQACQGRSSAPVSADAAAAGLAAAANRLRELEQQIRASFDRDSADEQHFPSSIDPRIYHVKLLLDFVGDLGGKRVLDAGCGKGRFAKILKERYPSAEIWGLDISEQMLRYVPESIYTRQGALTNLPFPDAHFDAVYAIESLEHAVEIEAAVEELCRVTRRQGRLLIIDKNVEMTGRLATPQWEKWFGRRELERLLKRHCRQVSSQPISYWEDVPPDGLFLAWKAVR